VLESQDAALLERLFRDRIVLIGEAMPYADRVAVPVNLAGWEKAARDSPAIVVHALSLRTALASAPREASRPLAVLLLSLAALLFLLRDWRVALAAMALAAIGAVAAATLALRAGLYISMVPLLATLAAAWLARALVELRTRRTRASPNIRHSI
jgi:CHASE2 domain-containing sensor protein